ncbi:hypothetical protein RM550_13355 [Streptomyces sp. DSM 41527]|uniref:Serine/threonine protein kinase n=1 Tax=Streptomyces mooreae TaxID=3075523 RepID=A0ABU2T666_9ACTN|nr:hypothetical protein [Streptomyces sp. DSM 41527]MDT0456711.1 hypothetical protein [Streptomyces sp. DSM 41527]
MSHSQQPAPFGQQPLLYALPYAPQPSAPQPSASPWSAPSSSPRPPKSPHAALRIAVGVACALLVLGLAAVVGSGGNGTKKARTKPAPTVTGTLGQGRYLVGKDIAAGAYRTAGPLPSDAPLCSWARTKGAGGEQPGSLIARGASRGPARVTVHKGETFETHGCREWTPVR